MPDTGPTAPATVTGLGYQHKLTTWVFQTLGAASVCWESLAEAGVFDSTKAKALGDDLVDYIEHCRWHGFPADDPKDPDQLALF